MKFGGLQLQSSDFMNALALQQSKVTIVQRLQSGWYLPPL
jgi:hypothetical protein